MTKLTHQPICPKCGYDQSGIIDSWVDSCPINGSCAECGLGFAWRDVFDPVRNDLHWYAEHTQSLWGIIARTPGTLMRLVLPWYYWRSVGVEARISLRALAMWLIVLAIGLHLLMSIPYGIGAWHDQSRYYGSLSNLYQNAGIKGLIQPLIEGIGWPFVGARVDFIGSSLRLYFPITNARIARSAFTPLFPLFGMTLVWALIMLVLPTTRRRAKIRAAHVYRAALISVFTLVLVFEMHRLTLGLDLWTATPPMISNTWARRFGGVVIPLLGLWVLLFWGSAVIVGWRVRPCGLLIVLGSIASLIGSVSVFFVLSTIIGWL
ncbi:MAG: hypothetical protein CMJ35_11345 [Phycisphaerae bacterium]|nr:hypothetical protein [Phycisphaerae bacterium]